MSECTAATEIVLFVAAALGLGLAIVCLTVAAGWKARAEAWQRAYCDVVAAAKPVADAARLQVVSAGCWSAPEGARREREGGRS